jgi:peptide maturation system acyl carrier-related protein
MKNLEFDMNIEESLEKIFYDKLKRDFNKEDLKEKSFFSEELFITPRDLVLVYYEIINYFNITNQEDILISKRFSTFNNVLNIVKESLIKKEVLSN